MTVRLRPDSEMLATSGTPVRLMPAVELSSSVRFSACTGVRTRGLCQLCHAGCMYASIVISGHQLLRVVTGRNLTRSKDSTSTRSL